MNLISTHLHREKRLKRLRIAMLATGVALAAMIGVAAKEAVRTKGASSSLAEQEPKVIQVTTMVVGARTSDETISTAGVVTAKTKIDVAALAGGTVQELLVDVGDAVGPNQLLARLYDSAAITNYETSNANYQHVSRSVAATKQSAEEAVRLARIAVEQANQSITSAETALRAAQSSYETTLPVHEQQLKKAIQDALGAYHTNLAGVQSSLDDINYIIRAEGVRQLDDISPTLSANDPASLARAREDWKTAKASYDAQILKAASEENVKERLAELSAVLAQTLTAANDAVAVLAYTTPNFLFSQAELEQERSTMISLKTSVASASAATVNSENGLDALSANQNKEQAALKNAIAAAENQLALARTARDASWAQLAGAEASQDQQVAGAQTSLVSSLGQRNLASQSVADLSVRSPIRGEVTARYVEVGTNVAQGQRIAEISQTDLVAVEVGLSQDLASRVRLGDVTTIEKTRQGVVSRIDPAADPFSRKITVEIAFDNAKRELVPETFVNVEIPLAPQDKKNAGSVLVPLKAVTITGNERYVFLLDGDRAKKVLVETGVIAGENIEIRSGLVARDELIVEGSKLLTDGQRVYVAP